MNDVRTFLLAAAAAVIVLAGGPAAAATHAAKVVYAFGEVRATDAAGGARQLGRGDPLTMGDTVSTARGRTQLKFTDGGFASLQPNTDYRIDEYSYEGREDGSERSFFNLVKGSVRFVTGIVGRTNKKNFRIATKVATIGIRGSSGVITADERGTFVTGEGLCAATAGSDVCAPLEDLVPYHCDGAACRKQYVREPERVEVEPELQDYVQGDQQDEQGKPVDVSAGGFVVTGPLIGGEAEGFGSPDTDAFNGLFIVTRNPPIAGVLIRDLNDNSDPFDPDIEFLTNDPDGLRQALNTFPDPEVVAIGRQIFDAIDPQDLESMRRNPTAVWDFETTPDGVVTLGRFAPADPASNGHLLEVEVFLDSAEVFSSLLDLRGHQSHHFWYGLDPGPTPGMGTGYYPITHSTPSTAVDGSSIGNGVLPFGPSPEGMGLMTGFLQVYFGTAEGFVDMIVDHNPMMLHVQGWVHFRPNAVPGEKFFEDDGEMFAHPVAALNGFSYPVQMHGAFAGPGASAGAPPQRFGASYLISVSPSPITGVFTGGPFVNRDLAGEQFMWFYNGF